jgi:hypothetical protein
MDKIRVRVRKVFGTAYRGVIYSHDLSEGELNSLNYTTENAPFELEVEGDFEIQWTNYLPFVTPYSIVISNKEFYLDEKDLRIDWDNLACDIESKIDVAEALEDREEARYDREEEWT